MRVRIGVGSTTNTATTATTTTTASCVSTSDDDKDDKDKDGDKNKDLADTDKEDQVDLIGPTFIGQNKWYGGIKGKDGSIYGIPYGSTLGVICVKPVLGISNNRNRRSEPGPEPEVTVLPLPSSIIDISNTTDTTDTTKSAYNWHGGVYSPLDGCIYGVPSHARNVLKIDTNAHSARLAVDGEEERGGGGEDGDKRDRREKGDKRHKRHNRGRNEKVTLLSDMLPEGAYKWGGAVVGHDGRIYCIPSDINQVLVIHPNTGRCQLVPIPTNIDIDTDIDIESSTADDDAGSTTTTTTSNNNAETSKTITTKNQWQGGVLVGKVIYAMPCNSRTILKINPGSNGPNSPPIVSEIGSGVIPSGRCKWQGGFLSESDGCIYGTFVHIHCILQKQYCF